MATPGAGEDCPVSIRAGGHERIRSDCSFSIVGRAPGHGVAAVGKSPAEATAESLA